jgi:hypothetical protein
MKRQLGLVLISTMFAVFTGACGGDDGGGGGGGGGKASDAIKDGIRASCAKAFDCMGSYDASMNGDTAFEDVYGTDEQNCYDMTIALINSFLGADYFDKFDASVEAGRITYNGDDADSCNDAQTSVTCDQFFGQNGQEAPDVPACDTALMGTVATGGACTISDDCASVDDSCDDSGLCNP